VCEYCGTNQEVGSTAGWIVTCCKSCSLEREFKEWQQHRGVEDESNNSEDA